jgi:hypothetical protein
MNYHEWRNPSLVVAALATVLRWQPGRNAGDPPSLGGRSYGERAMTTRPGTCRGGLSLQSLGDGGSVRVLAFRLR